MNKTLKKILIIIAAFFGFIIIALITLPILFKGKIKEAALKSINEKLDAVVSVGDVDISLFSTFPYIGVNLEQISVFGKKEFAGIPLFSAENLDVGFNLWSVIKGDKPYTIKKIVLDRPKINIQVLANGKANYDITKPGPPGKSTSEDFQVKLKNYEIKNGDIIYNNKATGMVADIVNLNHKGSGDFSSSLFDLVTTTKIDALSFSSGDIPYLSKAKIDLDATLTADMLNKKFSFKENSLVLNQLKLNCDGYVKTGEKDIEMDLVLKTPQNSFKDLFSIIPGAYTADFKDVQADGSFKFDAKIKGIYNETSIPSFDANIVITNGSVKYPKLPKGISAINASISVVNKGNQKDQTVLNINPLSLIIGSNPFNATFLLKTPISDPDVDAKIKGIINLADIAQAVPMKDIESLAGILNADVFVKTKNSYIESGQYTKVQMGGNIVVGNFGVRYKPYPMVQIKEAIVKFSPQFISIDNMDGKLGVSDIKGSGRIDNILAYFSPKLTMKGSFNLRSIFFNANEWLSKENEKPSNVAAKEPDQLKTGDQVFDRFDFYIDGYIGKLLYESHQINNILFKGRITPNKLQVNQFACVFGNSDLAASGEVNNMFNWLYKNQTLGGNVNVSSNFFDLNQFMQPEATSKQSTVQKQPVPNEKLEPVDIPDKIDMTVNGKFNKLLYTNMTLDNVNGSVKVADKAVRITNCTANSLGGKIDVSGGYNSKNKEKPGFDIKMGLAAIDIQSAFNTFNTFKTMAPIGKYMSGKFNLNMTMKGNLTKAMSPDFSTLSADGFIQTIAAVIAGFKPLADVGNKLGVEALKTIELKDTKNWVNINNGVVELKDFNYVYKDIAMTIGGKHSLTQEMDYKIKAKIPRKLLNQNAVGAAANSGLNFISQEAAKYGLNVSAGEYINMQIGIKGTISAPKLSFKVLGTEGKGTVKDQVAASAGAAFNSAKDSLQRRANQEIEKAKKQAQERANKMADSLSKVAKQKADDAIKKAEQQAKDKLNKEASDKTKKELEKAKEDLNKYNPFKKK